VAKAQNTFEELREFWRAAYSKLPDEIVDLEPTFKSWVEKILTDDGLTISSPIRQLFSAKPPEPFFGNWIEESCKLSVKNKTIVVLTNPGDGINFSQWESESIRLKFLYIIKSVKF
jgi:hypothetical protein